MSQTTDAASTPMTFTANGVAKASPGRLCGVMVAPTGAVTPTVTVYDNASAASGTILAKVKTVSATPFFIPLGDGVEAKLGIYVSADAFTTLTVIAYVK